MIQWSPLPPRRTNLLTCSAVLATLKKSWTSRSPLVWKSRCQIVTGRRICTEVPFAFPCPYLRVCLFQLHLPSAIKYTWDLIRILTRATWSRSILCCPDRSIRNVHQESIRLADLTDHQFLGARASCLSIFYANFFFYRILFSFFFR